MISESNLSVAEGLTVVIVPKKELNDFNKELRALRKCWRMITNHIIIAVKDLLGKENAGYIHPLCIMRESAGWI